jgi:PAS domain S-box-containing protein
MKTESTAGELRKTGVSVIGDVSWGTHFCYFYETKQDLLDLLIPYFKTGLEGNEFCLLIISNSELLKMEEATNALQRVLPDLDRYVAKRSIEFVGHDAWFLNGGSFDFQRVANQFKEKVDEARARGFVGMRVSASPAWLETSNPRELRKFEAEVDQLYPREAIIAACTYPIGRSKADFLLEVARNHQFAIARRNGDWDIVETPELKRAKSEIQRLNAELEQRVLDRTKKLEATTARLRAEIEDRKEAEGALRQSEERFAAFMDNLPGYAWMKDLQGRYVYVNEMVRGLPGYRSLGKTDAQIWPADLAAEYRANDEQVIATKKPLNTLEHFQLEGKKRYMAGSKFPIFDKTGAVALVGGAGVDITERIEAEEALRDVIDTIPVIAFTDMPDGSNEFTNRSWQEYTGLSVKDAAGWGWESTVHPDDIARFHEEWCAAVSAGTPFDNAARYRGADGQYRWFLVRAVPLRDERGNLLRWYGVLMDIEDRVHAEQALRESANRLQLLSRRLLEVQEEERRHLARELHDEIGQELTAAKINLQAAIKESDGAKSKRIHETTAILERLLGQVRQISLDLRPSMLDDLGLVPALRSLLDQQGRSASVAVHLSAKNVPENLDPEIQTACFRIAQEAITNAVRHANATRIDVDLGRENGNLRLKVRDNGRGFDAASAQAQAAGLGLVGIRERAALVDARAKIISSPKKGTTVEVSLPLTPPTERKGRETGP